VVYQHLVAAFRTEFDLLNRSASQAKNCRFYPVYARRGEVMKAIGYVGVEKK
jgi:hypothetical protein